MKFRKVTALFMAAAVLGSVGLTGCSFQGGGQSSQENSSTGSGDLLSKIQARGEIIIAMEGTWAPWTYHSEDGELVGFDVEVGQQIAEALGVETTFVEGEWLLSGRIDATLNAEVTYYDYMEAHPDANIKIACLDPEATQVAIPFRKGEDTASLREAVNQALADMRESGALAELSEKYFGTDITQPA